MARPSVIPDDLFDAPSADDEAADAMCDSFAPVRTKRPKARPGISDKRAAKLAADVDGFLKSKDWTLAIPAHFVVLYAAMHRRVYGCVPAELRAPERMSAARMADGLMAREFDNLPNDFAAFMRWTWVREEARERWRRTHSREGGRITWRMQFNGCLVTDYRIEAARQAAPFPR